MIINSMKKGVKTCVKLKVTEVSSLLGETPHVIRNWIREFRTHIPIEKAENGYNLYPPEAVEVLRTIQRLHRQQHYSTRQIDNYLSGGEITAAAAAETPSTLSSEVLEMKEMLQTLIDHQRKQEDFNRLLIDRLDHRDRQLTEYITDRRELLNKKEGKQSWIGRFKKLFVKE